MDVKESFNIFKTIVRGTDEKFATYISQRQSLKTCRMLHFPMKNHQGFMMY